ncbi:MAG: VWA domain-containing protein, partial [Hyphomicrobiales bacterium]
MAVGKPSGTVPSPSSSGEIADFVRQVGQNARTGGASGRGRLLFALDATMSRQPTWDLACSLQAEMFRALPADD